MAVARPYGSEIDFVRDPISGSAAWFFVSILRFIFTPIFGIKIYEKKFLDTKKISLSKPDFHKLTFISIKLIKTLNEQSWAISDPASVGINIMKISGILLKIFKYTYNNFFFDLN